MDWLSPPNGLNGSETRESRTVDAFTDFSVGPVVFVASGNLVPYREQSVEHSREVAV